MTRDQLFAGLFILSCVNGLFVDAAQSVHDLGWLKAIFATFRISMITWSACCFGIALALRDNDEAVSGTDVAVALVALCLLSLPFASLAWVTLTALALYVLSLSEAGSDRRRGAWILLAVTVPLFWSKLLFTIVGKPILEADALVVSLVTGTTRIGNVVGFADGSGYFQIFPGCSSLTNMSQAFLAWIAIGQAIGRRWSVTDLSWYVLACLSVIAVNVARLSLIGLYPQHFDTVHGPFGSAVTGWITLALIIGIIVYGFRREIFART